MKKTNIALAILAGAAIGGAVALILKAQSAADEDGNEDELPADEEKERPEFEMIARQFSDRIAAELHAAEQKIKSAVKKGSDLIIPEGEFGVFL